MSEIDPANIQLAGRNGHGEITVAMPRSRMTREQALVHAAWLVTLADMDEDEFAVYLDAVRNT